MYSRRKVNMCLTDGVYRQKGIHPIQLRAKDRKEEAREGRGGCGRRIGGWW